MTIGSFTTGDIPSLLIKEEMHMARWQPRTPKESLQASLERLKTRIQAKHQEIKDLEQQAKQVEQAIKALG
jgi:predicted  nucleic acid-binding Zn-ribbon protein